MKPLPQTKTRVEQNGEGVKNETVSVSGVLPVTLLPLPSTSPGNYTGFHGNMTQTLHSTGKKPQI